MVGRSCIMLFYAYPEVQARSGVIVDPSLLFVR